MTPLDHVKTFLSLGQDKLIYYAGVQKPLTPSNLEVELSYLESCLCDEGDRSQILDVVKTSFRSGLNPDNSIVVLARCCSYSKDIELRSNAYTLILEICESPNQLFLFLSFYKTFSRHYNNSNGWNRIHKSYMCLWYIIKPLREFVTQCTKHKKMFGWSHSDVFRLCHIRPYDKLQEIIIGYFVHGKLPDTYDDNEYIQYLQDYSDVQISPDKHFIIEKINKWKFEKEQIPDFMINDKDVLNALVKHMTISQILCENGVAEILEEFSDTRINVIKRFTNSTVKKSNINSLHFIRAQERLPMLYDTLDAAFMMSMQNIVPTNKSVLVAIDISPSMYQVAYDICPIKIACGLALMMKSSETSCDIGAFCHNFDMVSLNINDSIDNNIRMLQSYQHGGTIFSLPMMWALNNGKKYDSIIIVSDKENVRHPVESLKLYRREMNLNTRLVIFSLNTWGARQNIEDYHDDHGILDIVGYDDKVFSIIQKFL